MNRRGPLAPLALTLPFLAFIVACGSEDLADLTTGDITVTSVTTGDDLDLQYTVSDGTTPMSIESNGTATFSDLLAATYSVTLSDVATNCTTTSDNPQSATVVGGQTTSVSFASECVGAVPPHTLLAADRVGNVYTIDEATGAETLLLATTTDDGLGNQVDVGVVSSMHWIPPTELWWLGTGGRAQCDGCIQTLDLSTGIATTLLQQNNGVSGLAVHPTTDQIYTWQSDGTNQLFGIDATTAVFETLFTNLGLQNGGSGTTFSLDGVLYVATGDDLHSIDLATGITTLIGAMTYTGFPTFTETSQTIGSMATRPDDGVVFGILKDGGRSGTLQPTYLVTVNLETAEITNVGPHTETMDGLAFIMTALITP
jgi:hypothetical protein